MSQEPDDQGDLTEQIGRQPGPVSRAAFLGLFRILCLVFMFTELAIAAALSVGLAARFQGFLIGGVGMITLILARVAAYGILKERVGNTFPD
jgi:hypothetical protein